ncbi:AraC family transcriptional regulator [Telluribacter sp.]|jgi:AraC-like DNA-binding protein|uniref:AraC family transcriptional regulator n=1 Tax=Telluribacter sp. TaxID=1978767 RepID=UPI002E1079D2|nr:AraC family transcriptional regulator [Telluribacter sp.]
MKSALRKTIESQVRSFTVQKLQEPHFDPNWHFHPHYQLFTVLEGTGTRFIGDSITPFEPGDTVFLGPNIPHLWRSDAWYFEEGAQLTTRGIVLYFQEDFLGKDFFTRPELNPIAQLLEESKRGFQYVGGARQKIRSELTELLHLDGLPRILRLLALLDELAHSTEGSSIASFGYVNTHKVSETERMQKVHEYVMQNYQQEIRLTEAASLAGMSEAAFCRYFKTRANKTFTDFVSEIRIGQACKLLLEDKLSISQIAYESGFDTLSNFNRHFRRITGQTPRKYKKAYTIPV